LITVRWNREELWLVRCCCWSQRRASGAASTAGELISGSPCRSDGLADGRGNSEQDLCMPVAGTRLSGMLGLSCRHSGSARRSGGLAGGLRGTERRSRSLCLLARAGAGPMYWSSNSSVARGAEHRPNGGACWGWGAWIAWGQTNSSLCWGKFRRALLCYAEPRMDRSEWST
jgi:hypothetical protein